MFLVLYSGTAQFSGRGIPMCEDHHRHFKLARNYIFIEKWEQFDGLVNNAGILSSFFPTLETPKEDMGNLLETNLYSAINCIQVIGKKMIAIGKPSSVVNVSSYAAIQLSKNLLPYCLSRAGMNLVTKQFAH